MKNFADWGSIMFEQPGTRPLFLLNEIEHGHVQMSVNHDSGTFYTHRKTLPKIWDKRKGKKKEEKIRELILKNVLTTDGCVF